MKDELTRRLSLTDRLEAYLKARPGIWISMNDLALVAGIGGWRTRLSDCRLKRHMRIEHNGRHGSASMHRYLPYEPIGRDAADPAQRPNQKSLF